MYMYTVTLVSYSGGEYTQNLLKQHNDYVTHLQKTHFENPSRAESMLLFYLLVLEGLTTQCELHLVHQTEDFSLLTEGILGSEKVLGKD